MKLPQALASFAALAQDTRLGIVRLLVKAGPQGLAAGTIADKVGVRPSNLSFHLKALQQAGLTTSRRDSRSIIYAADFDNLRGLADFLLQDCCGGRPELCGPLSARTKSTKSSKA